MSLVKCAAAVCGVDLGISVSLRGKGLGNHFRGTRRGVRLLVLKIRATHHFCPLAKIGLQYGVANIRNSQRANCCGIHEHWSNEVSPNISAKHPLSLIISRFIKTSMS